MNPDDIREFARRDWARVEASKTANWIGQKKSMTLGEVVALGDRLRIHARALGREWPSAEERREDISTHQRVSEALGSVKRVSTT